MALLMALDSQSDTVGFDEVYNRTRRERRKVNRRSTGHRCMWCFIGLDVVGFVKADWYFSFSCFVFVDWVDLGLGFSFGGVVSLLSVFEITWMLICFCGLVDVGVGCVGLKAF